MPAGCPLCAETRVDQGAGERASKLQLAAKHAAALSLHDSWRRRAAEHCGRAMRAGRAGQGCCAVLRRAAHLGQHANGAGDAEQDGVEVLLCKCERGGRGSKHRTSHTISKTCMLVNNDVQDLLCTKITRGGSRGYIMPRPTSDAVVPNYQVHECTPGSTNTA